MISLKDFLSLKRVSFFWFIMPFFIDFTLLYFDNDKHSYLKLSILFFLILIFDYIYLKFIFFIKNKHCLFAFINSFLFLFFYYLYIFYFIVIINENTINLHLRARYIIPVAFVIVAYLLNKSRFKIKEIFYIINHGVW